jgi:small subunit ribosomal protein S14
MSNLIERDKQKRKFYLTFLEKREKLKNILKNREQKIAIRYTTQLKLNKLPKNASKVRVNNRCIITGRTHSVLKSFRISRIKVRELISIGLLLGVKKSSW